MRETDSAKIQLQHVLELDMNFSQAHFYLGEVFELESDYERAIEEHKRAVELVPFWDARVKWNRCTFE